MHACRKNNSDEEISGNGLHSTNVSYSRDLSFTLFDDSFSCLASKYFLPKAEKNEDHDSFKGKILNEFPNL